MTNGRTTVLVVEDDPQQRKLLREVLEELDCVVHEAATGEEGVMRYLANMFVDVFVCDFYLPGINGCRVYRAVEGLLRTRETRFFLVSGGFCDDRLTSDFYEVSGAPGVEFVEKPYDIVKLCEKIAGRE